jgi:hypothetical protein
VALASERPGEFDEAWGDWGKRGGGDCGVCDGVVGREDECFIAERRTGGGTAM